MPIKLFYYIIFYLLFSPMTVKSQSLKKVVKKVERNSEQEFVNDVVISSLRLQYKLVIGYSIYSHSQVNAPIRYYLIGYNKRKATAYYYLKNKITVNNRKQIKIDSFLLNKLCADSILKTFSQQKGWAIKYNDDNGDQIYCSNIEKKSLCLPNDAYSKSLLVLTKNNQSVSSFYAPEYFELECCPGNINRKRFLKIIAPIIHSFTENKKSTNTP